MKILFLGDIVGRPGRTKVVAKLPGVIQQEKIDFVIANGENAAHGFGITNKIAKDLFDAGVNVITSGNHIFDNSEIINHLNGEKRLLRPINYPSDTPGYGHGIYALKNGQKIMVINAVGQVFQEIVDSSFPFIENLLKKHPLKAGVDYIFVDFHAEATSEKLCFGNYFDGRVSAVVGTHTHIPTADEHVLPRGTAYQTDAGMCGDYDSIIGMTKESAISRYLSKTIRHKFEPAEGEATLSGVIITLDETTGLAKAIVRWKL